MISYISPLPDASLAEEFPRSVMVLGSTGSIGVNALKVMAEHPSDFHVVGLAAGENAELLAEQARSWRPLCLGVLHENAARRVRELLPSGYRPEIFVGPAGYAAMAALPEARLVLSAQSGAAGLPSTLAAARTGKIIALANKESLVAAGDLVREACRASGATILPVDSEHNAVFQAVAGHNFQDVRRIILTASGGPLRGLDKDALARVTPEQALNHPNWSMGAKISVDSATLMNKGLEIIEASHLFGLDLSRIDVAVHPQSIVHSLAEFRDGSILAHLGPPDMRIPIAYCLGYPRRLGLDVRPLDLIEAGTLTFEAPDLTAFPCLGLAMEALTRGLGHPTALNAANEVTVELFLAKRIRLTDFARLISQAMEVCGDQCPGCLEDVLALDNEARSRVREWAAAI